jgi:single-stranded-DNA-specific exonuclease
MRWLDPPPIQPSDVLRDAVGGHLLVAEVLARRGISDPAEALAFLDPDRYHPAPPTDLPDVERAARRLLEAIRHGERILVWGDFDVDGQTATALLVDSLSALGGNVAYFIPNRLSDGHGVFTHLLQPFLDDGIDVLLTCDTGVTAHAAIQAAREAGVVTLVTDHHQPPPDLPIADTITNPQLLPEGHPSRDLPGVGVAYLLMQHLYDLAGRGDEIERALDLVALGIVADVAVQTHDTRYLLQRGLARLREPERVGLGALMREAQLDPRNLSTEHIGFQIGPRLNALGRLDDANQAVELLTTSDEARALALAAYLEGLNERRKQITDQIYAAAQEQIAKDPSLLDFEALVLAGAWHPGVIGIVAARLVEAHARPAVLLSLPPEGLARGSARSVPGVDIGACIASVGDLLIEHGGHAGAAGLSLDPDLIPQLRRQLSTAVAESWDRTQVEGLQLDALVSLDQVTLELADELDRLAPFGEGNPPVHLMAPGVQLVSSVNIGRGGRHRRLVVADTSGTSRQVLWWNAEDHPEPPSVFDLAFVPRVNDYKGTRTLQLEWLGLREVAVAVEVRAERQLIDERAALDPLGVLAGWQARGEVMVWAEGFPPGEGPGVRLHALEERPTLVVWTAPPGPRELANALARVRPEAVVVIGQTPAEPGARELLEWLLGAVRYALNNEGGVVDVPRLAGRLAQRDITVRRGLEWLEAKGYITLAEWLDDERVSVVAGGSPNPAALEPLQDALRALLAEAAAYRRRFRRDPLPKLFAV